MQVFVYPDPYMRRILREVKTIAVVGASSNLERPSFQVMHYLQSNGYRILPVNPGLAGDTILGERVYRALNEIPEPFDMADIFRTSDAVPAIVEDAIALAPDKGISVIWMQLGVFDIGAAERAKAAGFDVIMNRCPKIEHRRLVSRT